jgi:acyl carrier protein
MTTSEDARTVLPTIVHDIAGIPLEEIRPDAAFAADLAIDSLTMVEIMVAAEETFGVEIPDEELTNLTTIDAVVAYIERVRA